MNGLHQSHQVADEEQPTERTALLGRTSTVESHASDAERQEPSRPPIEPIVARLQQQGLPTDYSWCPDIMPSAERPAFIVVTLLQLRSVLLNQIESSGDSWDQWLREQHRTDTLDNVAKQISQTWAQFLADVHTAEDVEEFLWTDFPLGDDATVSMRVVDFLGRSHCPDELVSHRVVLLSLHEVWRRGRHPSLREASRIERLGVKFDALCTPRAIHLLDLTMLLGYIGILAHYALLPPDKPIEAGSSEWSIRAILLIIYSFSRLCQPWSIFTVPFLLVLLAFITSLPFTPSREDNCYSVVLLALTLHILLLQLPHPPGPLHLFPAEQALPVAILIWHGVSRVFFPVVMFFLPSLLLALFLLSTSLSDTLFQPFVLLTLNPSPMEARTVFLVLFALLFILLICSLLVLALVYPSVTSGPPVTSAWDRYSRSIGIEARRTFVRTVVIYSTPCKILPPFNILEAVLLQVPAFVLRLTGQKYRKAWLTKSRRILWRITVGPLALILAGVWAWGICS